MYRRGMKEYNALTELEKIQYDPTVTCLGDIVIEILKQYPTIFSSQIKAVYKRADPDAKNQKQSISLSGIFDRLSHVTQYKGFAKCYLMKQFLVSGVYMVKRGTIRNRVCFRIYLTDRNHLYDHVDESKREYFIQQLYNFYHNKEDK